MKVNAVACDRKVCTHLQQPAEDAEIPEGWLAVDIYIEGDGNQELRVFCSWACMSMWANDKIVSPPKRKRRTRAEMEADEAAARRLVDTTPVT